MEVHFNANLQSKLVRMAAQQGRAAENIVAPGASAKPIRLEFAGAKKLDLTTDG